jgi:hypothetical protein
MNKTNPTVLTETENNAIDPESQFVSGPHLLKILFSEDSRPTTKWLRDQRKARRIPCVKIGRLAFYCPAAVRAALTRNQTNMGDGRFFCGHP